MSRWFRFYDDALNDPKVQGLSPVLFKHWMNVLCVASKNNGNLPSVADIAFCLRLKEREAAVVIRDLTSAGLIDSDGQTSLRPHNWNARQFKSDVSNERVKRHRNAKRNVTPTVTVTPPDTEQRQKEDDGDARARGELVSRETYLLADELAEISGLGRDPKNLPPGWCGAPMRIQGWLDHGWPRELILSGAREAMARKPDGPPSTVNYFEKPIARAVAYAAKPLPVVNLDQTPEVINGKANRGNIQDASKLVLERIRKFNEPAPDGIRGGEGGAHVRLLSQG